MNGNVTAGDTPGFPITISRPGTYKFAGNIYPTAGQRGIQVTARFVTIDFAGFALQGGEQANIGILSGQSSLTIKNGTIALFNLNAIRGSGPYWTIDNMRIYSNGEHGIHASGSAAQWIISNSEIVENGESGIEAPTSSGLLIRNNIVSRNGMRGISVGGAHVEGNMVSENAGSFYGIAILDAGTVLGNTLISSGLGMYGTSLVGYGNNTFAGTGDQVIGGYPTVSERLQRRSLLAVGVTRAQVPMESACKP